jgi:MoxR-like ATPase
MTLSTDHLTTRIRALCDHLSLDLVERQQTVRLALLATLAGEHVLLLGPPGTAKSLVARRLKLAFAESSYFERLLTRFTVPEELFGPLSIQGLEEDRYERLTAAYLPEASIAFLDEIFKANSAILNALLTLLNEREFDNGTRRVRTPLIAVVGASNEAPEAGELDALFDRFLVRVHVGPVARESFAELLALRGNAPPKVADSLGLTSADLASLGELAELVEVPDDVVAILCDLRDWCTTRGIQVSDRRWRKVVKLLQVSAFTNGRERVSVWDCWLVQHCVWNRPEERAEVYAWYAARVGASAAMNPSRLKRIVASWEARLQEDRNSRSQMRDSRGRLLFAGPKGNTPKQRVQKTREDKPLFLAPHNAHGEERYYRTVQITDRTKDGKGYTRDELDALHILPEGSYVLFQHWPERDAYLADESNWLMGDEHNPAMEPTRHKAAYVEACLRDTDALRAESEAYNADLAVHLESLEEEIGTHLWVSADFVEPASESLRRTQHEVETLLGRIERLRAGFDNLPREAEAVVPEEDEAGSEAPAPAPKPSAGARSRPAAMRRQ